MGRYLAIRIEDGYLDYDKVVEKYPQFKDEIDLILGGDYAK
jgi:hypothetical protein